MMRDSDLLARLLAGTARVLRRTETVDAAGAVTAAFSEIAVVPARLGPITKKIASSFFVTLGTGERAIEADAACAVPADADVRAGDEIEVDGARFSVIAVRGGPGQGPARELLLRRKT
jgi:hypothetical protein